MSISNLYENNIFDVSIVIVYFFIIILLSRKFKSLGWQFHYLAIAIGILHLLMSVIYNYYSLSSPSDSRGYFYNSLQDNILEIFTFGDGTTFISIIITPLTKFLGLSYLGCNLLFSIISLVGIYRLYQLTINLLNKKWSLWFLLFLMPSLHFWTGFLGKDALLFYGMCTLIYNAYYKKRLIYYIIPLLVIMFARFYIFAFIAVGYGITLVLLSKSVKLYMKIFLGVIGFFSSISFLPIFLNLVGLTDVENISKKRNVILQANLEGGSGLDLSESNMFVRFFSYLFRPFIYEAHNITSLLASFENIFWIIIFFLIIKNIFTIIRNQNNLFWFCICTFFTIILPAAYILSNLGIASRQKIMVLPLVLYVFFVVLKRKNLVK